MSAPIGPRAHAATPQVTHYELSLQFVELYNEQLLDLFGSKKVVDVTMDPNGGYRCKDAVTHICKNYDEAMQA